MARRATRSRFRGDKILDIVPEEALSPSRGRLSNPDLSTVDDCSFLE